MVERVVEIDYVSPNDGMHSSLIDQVNLPQNQYIFALRACDVNRRCADWEDIFLLDVSND